MPTIDPPAPPTQPDPKPTLQDGNEKPEG